jgi:hypothetical protein
VVVLDIIESALFITMALENNGKWGSLQQLNKYLWIASWK